jgi:hypothetical protein
MSDRPNTSSVTQAQNSSESQKRDPGQPWSTRRPQRYFFTLGIIILMVAVVSAGFGFISGGEGGIVPFLMILAAPVLGVFYIWYFNFSEFAKGDSTA